MGRTDADPRTIALLNQKGGVGKTTSTVNLGAALADLGMRVCLIDLDPQAHLTLHLGYESGDLERSVYDLFIDPDVTAEDVRIGVRERLDLLPAVVDLAAAEIELADHPDRQRILKRKLAPIAASYDFVLLDCPPSLGLLTLNALALAREVFVPMQAHFLALQGVGKLLETVGLVCRSVNPQLEVTGIILCMHEGNTTLSREVVADLEGFFEQARDQNVPWRTCRVLQPPVRRNIKLAEAPSFGATIFDYEPWCPGAIDYRRLAKGIVAERGGSADDGAARSIGPPASAVESSAAVRTVGPPPEAEKAVSSDDRTAATSGAAAVRGTTAPATAPATAAPTPSAPASAAKPMTTERPAASANEASSPASPAETREPAEPREAAAAKEPAGATDQSSPRAADDARRDPAPTARHAVEVKTAGAPARPAGKSAPSETRTASAAPRRG